MTNERMRFGPDGISFGDRRQVTLDGETADKIAVDVLKDHYHLLYYKGHNESDKKMYKKLRKAFRLIVDYYGERIEK